MSGAGEPLRVVVVGATGNIGTSVVRELGGDPRVAHVVGLARRLPRWSSARTTWAVADVSREDEDLVRHFAGADAVIHLAWLFHPSRRPVTTWRTNVLGSDRVFRAVAAAGVPALVHASSVAAYSPGPAETGVDESWPTHGWPGAAYCREKAYVERLLDGFEHEHPDVRVVRMRPGIVVKRESAAEQRRIFIGPLLPRRLVHPEMLPVIPDFPGLRFQVTHTDDVADAFRRAVVGTVCGAFNLAAGPVVDARMLAGLFGSRVVRAPGGPLRAAAAAAHRLRLVPAPAGMLEAVLEFPLMNTGRATDELGWVPRLSAGEAITEFLEGLREGAGMATAPLRPRLRGGRLQELATGMGARQ